MKSTVMYGLGVATLVGSGCATKESVAPTAPPTQVADVEAAGQRYVPAGTSFTVAFQQPISTETSSEGERVTAVVTHELRAADGTVVVPAWSVLRGSVAEVDSGTTPILKIAFSTLETTRGPAELDAKIEGADTTMLPGRNEIYDPSVAEYDALLYGAPIGDPPTVSVGAPMAYGYYDVNAGEIRVPRGGNLRLELTRPIVLPAR